MGRWRNINFGAIFEIFQIMVCSRSPFKNVFEFMIKSAKIEEKGRHLFFSLYTFLLNVLYIPIHIEIKINFIWVFLLWQLTKSGHVYFNTVSHAIKINWNFYCIYIKSSTFYHPGIKINQWIVHSVFSYVIVEFYFWTLKSFCFFCCF